MKPDFPAHYIGEWPWLQRTIALKPDFELMFPSFQLYEVYWRECNYCTSSSMWHHSGIVPCIACLGFLLAKNILVKVEKEGICPCVTPPAPINRRGHRCSQQEKRKMTWQWSFSRFITPHIISAESANALQHYSSKYSKSSHLLCTFLRFPLPSAQQTSAAEIIYSSRRVLQRLTHLYSLNASFIKPCRCNLFA